MAFPSNPFGGMSFPAFSPHQMLGLLMNNPLLEASMVPRYTLTEAAAIFQFAGATLAQPFLLSFSNTATLMSQLNQTQQPIANAVRAVQASVTDSVPTTEPEPRIAFRLTGPPIKPFDNY